ncbi:shikimate 5-dehydrogenase [Acetobacter oeni LMG 21952]|nr:shikimate 5-dehydrogenase [Acetobacter oeni LMG 21952]
MAHVRTPQKMNALFESREYDGVMVAVDAAPGADLAAVFAGFRAMANFGGTVVTVPHKTSVVALCDRVSRRAEMAGAANVVRRERDGSLTGDLLDGVGFVAGLTGAEETVAGRRVFLAGAGGAASAIAFALAEAGAAHLTVANRSREKAGELAGRLSEAFPVLSVAVGGEPDGHDIVVNGTSLGLREGDPLPVDAGRLSSGMLVAEVVMMPEETALLREAAKVGCRVHSGRHMLEGQLEAIFAFLTGVA